MHVIVGTVGCVFLRSDVTEAFLDQVKNTLCMGDALKYFRLTSQAETLRAFLGNRITRRTNPHNTRIDIEIVRAHDVYDFALHYFGSAQAYRNHWTERMIFKFQCESSRKSK